MRQFRATKGISLPIGEPAVSSQLGVASGEGAPRRPSYKITHERAWWGVKGPWRGEGYGYRSRRVRDVFRSGQKRLDAVGDILRGRAELGDGPVACEAFGDGVGAGVVD